MNFVKNQLKLFFLTMISFQMVNANATQKEAPKSVVALGDSITAGAIAHLTRQDGYNPLLLPKILGMIAQFGIQRSMEAFEIRSYSWAAGLDKEYRVDSHSQRLKFLADRQNKKSYHFNAAVSGARTSRFPDQLEKIEKWVKKNPKEHKPEHAIMLMGPNDVCSDNLERMTKTDLYFDRFEKTISSLRTMNPEIKVLLVGTPNLEHLRKTAKDSNVGFLKCKQIWEKAGYCDNILVEKDPEKRAQVDQRVRDYNQALEDLAARFNNVTGEDSVRASTSIYDLKFTDDDVSVDCFHPNRSGQNLLAETSFEDSWWKDDFQDLKSEYNKKKSAAIRAERRAKRKRSVFRK